ncbi:MAG: Fic family protein [Candidatus Dormiibacterota bacterium]
MRLVLASDPTIVIALTDCAAYSNGFEFLVAARSKEDLDHRLLGFGPPIPPGAKEPDGLFRITVRFADGGSASSDYRDGGGPTPAPPASSACAQRTFGGSSPTASVELSPGRGGKHEVLSFEWLDDEDPDDKPGDVDQEPEDASEDGLEEVAEDEPDFASAFGSGGSLRPAFQEAKDVPGVLAERVAAELRRFEESLSRRLVNLDAESPGDVSESAALLRVVELASFGHGEWVRIHPFADGNGRTARILSNWILVRMDCHPCYGCGPGPIQSTMRTPPNSPWRRAITA